jgi:hypothetical protein
VDDTVHQFEDAHGNPDVDKVLADFESHVKTEGVDAHELQSILNSAVRWLKQRGRNAPAAAEQTTAAYTLPTKFTLLCWKKSEEGAEPEPDFPPLPSHGEHSPNLDDETLKALPMNTAMPLIAFCSQAVKVVVLIQIMAYGLGDVWVELDGAEIGGSRHATALTLFNCFFFFVYYLITMGLFRVSTWCGCRDRTALVY